MPGDGVLHRSRGKARGKRSGSEQPLSVRARLALAADRALSLVPRPDLLDPALDRADTVSPTRRPLFTAGATRSRNLRRLRDRPANGVSGTSRAWTTEILATAA